MNRKKLSFLIFELSTLSFFLWIFFIHVYSGYLQNLRMWNVFWLSKGVFPWLYLLVFINVFFSLVIFHCKINNKLLHIMMIIYLSLIIDATPYFLSNYYRFPDTFGVAMSSTLLPEILSHKLASPYPQSFPLPYMYFYITQILSAIDFYTFSTLIFSPIIITLIFILWYIFVKRIFGPRTAFISTIIAIPTQIIEVTISPNSIGIVLLFICLVLSTFSKNITRLLFVLVLIGLVLSHAITPVILIFFLGGFFLINLFTKNYIFDVGQNKLFLLPVLWLSWLLLSSSPMGGGILKSLVSILKFDTIYFDKTTEFTVGSGGLASSSTIDYSWIQELNMIKYVMYMLFVILLIMYEANYISKKKKLSSLQNEIILKYSFLTISFLLLVCIILLLSFGGQDVENIISRFLNYSLFSISVFIALSFTSNYFFFSPTHSKILKSIFFIFMLVIYVSYPFYSYAKDSYINYPLSEKKGDQFYFTHISHNLLEKHDVYSKSSYFYGIMHGKKTIFPTNSIIYKNGWYSIYV